MPRSSCNADAPGDDGRCAGQPELVLGGMGGGEGNVASASVVIGMNVSEAGPFARDPSAVALGCFDAFDFAFFGTSLGGEGAEGAALHDSHALHLHAVHGCESNSHSDATHSSCSVSPAIVGVQGCSASTPHRPARESSAHAAATRMALFMAARRVRGKHASVIHIYNGDATQR